MTRRALLASVAGLLFFRPDDDNPEITAEELRRARPAAQVLPELIGQKATDEVTRKNLHLWIPPELLARIQLYTREQNITLDEFVRRAVDDHLAHQRRAFQPRLKCRSEMSQ